MKLVITGASGPFGYNTTQGLLDRGIPAADLILVSRNPEKLNAFADLGATVRQGDFDDYDSLLAAFSGGEKMLMISTNRVGQREPQHRNAVNAAKAAGIRHIVYTSFVGKPENDDSLAVRDHRFTENLIRQAGMQWTFLRNSQYTEAMRDAGAPAALNSGQWLSASGDGRIAMISREDCIRAAIAVMATDGHQGKTYDITGPELISYRELCDLVSELADKPITYRGISAEELYAFFDSLGIPRSAKDDHVVDGFGWCSDDMVSFETMIKNGGFAVISDDMEKLTGERPETVREFLTRYKEMFTGAA
jgi:NAD(P)H dehydrogenase (quinone)